MELCAIQLKVEHLEAELKDLSSQESKDESSLSKTKKTFRDLEAKVKDQEEELDEQAGTIQMLEQVKEVKRGRIQSLYRSCLSRTVYFCVCVRPSYVWRWGW
jgi:chromosome segregation ATPase